MAKEAEASTGLNIDPMHQFEIFSLLGEGGGKLGPLDFTNSALWMVIVVLVATGVFVIGSQGRALVPTRMQSVAEVLYDFVRKTIRDTSGEEGLKYFPVIFSVFIFILLANLLGLIPYSFTVTSHLAVTVTLALGVFATVIVVGFLKHGLHFFSFFVPKDCPAPLLVILVPIEVISFFVRPVSHSVRLAANMLAGHAVLKVFAGFVFALGPAGVLPLAAMVGVYGLEVLVAVVQAYIFMILTSIYLNDALHLH